MLLKPLDPLTRHVVFDVHEAHIHTTRITLLPGLFISRRRHVQSGITPRLRAHPSTPVVSCLVTEFMPT
jgi:hypothetical protein